MDYYCFSRRPWVTISVLACIALVAGCTHPAGPVVKKTPPPVVTQPQLVHPEVAEASEAQVRQFCSACHTFPPPSAFPKSEWRTQVVQAFRFVVTPGLKRPDSAYKVPLPSLEPIVKWYENRAPDSIPEMQADDDPGPPPTRYQKIEFDEPGTPQVTGISNVNLVHLYSKDKMDLLACDMFSGNILVMKPYEKAPKLTIVAKLHFPAHAEVVDLDKDGIKDIIVADLGVPFPSDKRMGQVVWLRGQPDGTFKPYTLLSGVGRVADVEMADFYGTGRNDLVVGEFGNHLVGSTILLENKTTDWSHPKFVPHTVDDRTGALHVPICDLNHDGKPDFVDLIAQEHEQIVAFLNQGNGVFKKEIIYTAPHPAVGSSGIQLVDMNHDGKLDVLYTCGDAFDPHAILRPDDGVTWFENQGKFPFAPHHLTNLQSAYRAITTDADGDGKADIFAVGAIPAYRVPKDKPPIDSAVLLRQTAPGKYTRYALEKGDYFHVSAVSGDIYGDGKQDLVTGFFAVPLIPPTHGVVTIWRNLGPGHG